MNEPEKILIGIKGKEEHTSILGPWKIVYQLILPITIEKSEDGQILFRKMEEKTDSIFTPSKELNNVKENKQIEGYVYHADLFDGEKPAKIIGVGKYGIVLTYFDDNDNTHKEVIVSKQRLIDFY